MTPTPVAKKWYLANSNSLQRRPIYKECVIKD